jgi:hypothetical protein
MSGAGVTMNMTGGGVGEAALDNSPQAITTTGGAPSTQTPGHPSFRRYVMSKNDMYHTFHN